MKITFLGAVRTTTGSMHLVEAAGLRILLDCGLYQGKRKEAFERNRKLPVDPASIDLVLLSHAHIDHSGNLPSLVKHGFRGRIIATHATRDLCEIMLLDTAHIQENDVLYVNRKRRAQGQAPFEPLYTAADAVQAMTLFESVAYDTELELAPGLTVAFHDAGHVLGSAQIRMDDRSAGRATRLLFTGDLGRKNMPILKDPAVVNDVDVLLTESTYGNRLHPSEDDVSGRLKAFMEDVLFQNARMIIPAFSVGRTQQLVYCLDQLHRKGRIPPVPVFVDSPLAARATEVHQRHRECYDKETLATLLDGDGPFQFGGLRYIKDAAESKGLNELAGPAVILSSSGMCEGGRILHHLKNNIGDPRNIVLFVGYQAENTLGRRLVEHVSPVRIFGEEHIVRARIHTINALSGHADRGELLDYFRAMNRPARRAFVVHGEEEAGLALATELRGLGCPDVVVPVRGQTVTV